jgi:hypothetical protein
VVIAIMPVGDSTPTIADDVLAEPSALTLAGATAGIALAALLVAGALPVALGLRWAGGLQNWLVVLLGFHATGTGLAVDAIRGVKAVDVAALALAGVTFLGARPALGAANRIWGGIGAALPFAGIVALLATASWGRPALAAGGLVLAWRMTKRDRFRLIGWTGVIANGFLFMVDVQETGPPDPAAGDVIAVAYGLFLLWLVWLVVRMLRPLPGRPVPIGVHLVGPGGGCRAGGSDTTEMFDLPLFSRAEGALGTYVGVAADGSTRFTVNGATVTLMRFLEAYDEDVPFEVRVEQRGRLAAMAIETGRAAKPPSEALAQ